MKILVHGIVLIIVWDRNFLEIMYINCKIRTVLKITEVNVRIGTLDDVVVGVVLHVNLVFKNLSVIIENLILEKFDVITMCVLRYGNYLMVYHQKRYVRDHHIPTYNFFSTLTMVNLKHILTNTVIKDDNIYQIILI